jgi:hypothetical protein
LHFTGVYFYLFIFVVAVAEEDTEEIVVRFHRRTAAVTACGLSVTVRR